MLVKSLKISLNNLLNILKNSFHISTNPLSTKGFITPKLLPVLLPINFKGVLHIMLLINSGNFYSLNECKNKIKSKLMHI